MTTPATTIDPRPLFGRTLDQAGHLATTVRPDHLDAPTPCSEYDVRTLLGHLVAVLRRIAHVGSGGDPSDLPLVVNGITDDGWATAWFDARGDVERVWADDAVLDRMLTLPWGALPGRAALRAYAQEFTVHAWDLAVATRRLGELDPELGAVALESARQFVPTEPRGGRVPFGPVVPVASDADVYTQLAAYLGRQPDGSRISRRS